MSKGNMLKQSRTSWTVSLMRRRWWPHEKPVPDSLYNDVYVVRVCVLVLYFILGFAMLVILLYLLDNHFCDRFSAFDLYGLIFVGLIVLWVKDTWMLIIVAWRKIVFCMDLYFRVNTSTCKWWYISVGFFISWFDTSHAIHVLPLIEMKSCWYESRNSRSAHH
jgi:hypothetical protein